MTNRRSGRSHKSVDYSKLSSEGNDDDDDFVEATPPTKRSKNQKQNKKEKKEELKPKEERKSRNRLTPEEKYEKELELALKISLEKDSKAANDSSDNSQLQSSDTRTSHVVEADVLDSPNSKLNSRNNENVEKPEKRKEMVNEAAMIKEDKIESEPEEDNKETTRRRRSKIIKEKEEEEYKMSGEESESDEDSSPDVTSEESDYEETPKKKKILKKSEPVKKSNNVKEKSVPEAEKMSTSVTKRKILQGKENAPPTPKTAINAFKPLVATKQTTPKSSGRVLSALSPALHRPSKFIHSSWTPPGPAGTKSSLLKSPQSPNYIRIGLSRNFKTPKLHPKANS